MKIYLPTDVVGRHYFCNIFHEGKLIFKFEMAGAALF